MWFGVWIGGWYVNVALSGAMGSDGIRWKSFDYRGSSCLLVGLVALCTSAGKYLS